MIVSIAVATALWSSTVLNHVSKDERCLIRNAYHEARSEGIEGMVAVTHVVLNRVASPKWPDTPCEVIWQKGQFSWTHDGKSDRMYDDRSELLAIMSVYGVLNGHISDPTGGAVCYHADYVNPLWAKKYKLTAVIRKHLFYDCEEEER